MIKTSISILLVAVALCACGNGTSDGKTLDTFFEPTARDTVEPSNTNIDEIMAVNVQELPTGCIGDRDTSGMLYCVYAESRIFVASFADGTTLWSFTLPGDNESNEIEAVNVIGNEVVLIADKSPSAAADASEKYELSRFEKSGAFIETININLLARNDVDLCKDAWCAYYNNSNLLPYPNQQGENIIASAATTPNGQPGLHLGWSRYHSKEYDNSTETVITVFEGGVVSLLELVSGQSVAEHLYPQERVEKIGTQVNGNTHVTTDNRESQLNPDLVLTNQPEHTAVGISDKPIAQWIKEWNAVVSANPLDVLAEVIDYLVLDQDWPNGTAIEDDIDQDSFFGENAITEENIAVSTDYIYAQSKVESLCAAGGLVTITSENLSPQQFPSSLRIIETRHYQFNQCAFSIDENAANGANLSALQAGSYLLHGDFLTHRKSTNTRTGSSEESTFSANTFQINFPEQIIETISGKMTLISDIDARNFIYTDSLLSNIDLYSKTVSDIETRRLSGFSRDAMLTTSNILSSWDATVQGHIFDIELGEKEHSVQTTQPFNRINNKALSNKPYDTFTGEISISDEGAIDIKLQALSDQASPYTREWISISAESNAASTYTTIPMQSFFAPMSIEP